MTHQPWVAVFGLSGAPQHRRTLERNAAGGGASRRSRKKLPPSTNALSSGARSRAWIFASSTPGCSQGPSDPNSTLRAPARRTACSSKSNRRTPDVSVWTLGWRTSRSIIASCARQSSEKLLRCGMMNGRPDIRSPPARRWRLRRSDVVEHRQRVGARHLADLAGDPRIVAVHLNPDEPVLDDRLRHHVDDASAIPLRDERRRSQKTGPAGWRRSARPRDWRPRNPNERRQTGRCDRCPPAPPRTKSPSGAFVSHGPVSPSPFPAWQWQSMIMAVISSQRGSSNL